MSGFAERRIDVAFTRIRNLNAANATPNPQGGAPQNPTFADTGTNQLRVSGLRVSAEIERQGSALSNARLRIFGLTRYLMNDLSTMGRIVLEGQFRNLVSIYAGNAGQALPLAYSGSILTAFADFRAMPDVGFEIVCQDMGLQSVAPVPAISLAGSVDVAQLLQTVAAQMGLTFENSGVTGVKLANPNYPGTAIDQAKAIADHAGINMVIDNGTMAIWPVGGVRSVSIPLISPATGLIGFPSYQPQGLGIQTRYNPSIKIGGQVQVQSELDQASGNWMVHTLLHHLEAQVPGGAWFSQLQVSQVGIPVLMGPHI